MQQILTFIDQHPGAAFLVAYTALMGLASGLPQGSRLQRLFSSLAGDLRLMRGLPAPAVSAPPEEPKP